MFLRKISTAVLAATAILLARQEAFLVNASTGVDKYYIDNLHWPDVQYNLALYGSPLFHFGHKAGHATCYPTWAFDQWGNKMWPVPVKDWPDFDSGCANQPQNFGWGPKFPVYFTVKKCGEDVRVSYSVFFQKDGVNGNGHEYDWETVVVVWRNFGGTYYKDEIMLSQHTWFVGWRGWENYPQTTDRGQWWQAGERNKDHPKVYVGICKHALYAEMNHSGATVADCVTFNEYRGDQYYNVAEENWTLLRASWDTDEGKRIIANDFGKASSKPTVMWDRLCDISY